MRRAQTLLLHLARTFFLASTLLAVGLSFVLVRSYWQGTYLTRTDWFLSATHDRWSTLEIGVTSGWMLIRHADDLQQAFTGQFIDGVPFSPSRTDPVGVKWEWSDRPGNPFGRMSDSPAIFRRLGIIWQTPYDDVAVLGANSNIWWVQIRLATLCVIAWGVTALAFFAARRAGRDGRRLRAGLCPTCGYDIRATPERCPECGVITPQ